MSLTGCTVPTSLLAHGQWTSEGSKPYSERHCSIASSTACRWRVQNPSTTGETTSANRADESRAAECSIEAQITGPGERRVAPHTALLIDSVPPEVRMKIG